MQRYYLDTCIWVDYLENRQDRFRPLGDWALRLIKQIVNSTIHTPQKSYFNKYTLVQSKQAR
jgi:hypothetical protein